jgi:LuxR family maltose regulon positive regulatory protein
MPGPLLTTKLYVARDRLGALQRPRLMQLLDEGLSARLTLVSAPAGFGKTTLIAQWLHGTAERGPAQPSVAWVSLDARDSDPDTFWSYVFTALQSALPHIGGQELGLRAADSPPVQQVLAGVLNDLAADSTDVVLVLDDYHAIESREIDEAMSFLFEHAPQGLHVVLTSRSDPAFPLARLRARRELVEVRATDLRFTPDEAATYLNETMGLRLTASQVRELEQRTEGWIAALQLAALSLAKHEDVAGFVAAFTGDDRYIVDYLVEEVLQSQPPKTEAFLLQTSVLDRLTGALCDEVTGQVDSTAILHALDRANMFLVPLDDQRRWYRYHHLFADVLRTRLDEQRPEQVAELHRRASGWYARNGERAEAIEHSLAAADFSRAATLIEAEVPETRKQRRETTLAAWLGRLPDDLVRAHPVLCVAYAGTLLATGTVQGVHQRLLDAEQYLDSAERADLVVEEAAADDAALTREQVRSLRGWVALYRSAHALVEGRPLPMVEQYAGIALDLLEDDDLIGRAAAAALQGLAAWGRGQLEEAHQAYALSSSLFRKAGHVSDVLACTITMADIRRAQGRLGDAMRAYERGLLLATQDPPERGPQPRGTADMHVGMSEVHRERGDLDAARRCLASSDQLGERNGLPQNAYRWNVAMAGVAESDGDLEKTVALLDEAARTYTADFSPDVRPVSAMRARALVKQGRLDEAFDWAKENRLTVDDELSYVREFEHLTLARVLVARRVLQTDPHALSDADRLLARLLEAAERGGRTGSVLQVLVLQALSLQARGDHAGAVVLLQRALVRAEPEQYARVFLDEGEPLLTLLRAAGSAGTEPSHATACCGACRSGTFSTARRDRRGRPSKPLSGGAQVHRLLAPTSAGLTSPGSSWSPEHGAHPHPSIYASSGDQPSLGGTSRCELDLLRSP